VTHVAASLRESPSPPHSIRTWIPPSIARSILRLIVHWFRHWIRHWIQPVCFAAGLLACTRDVDLAREPIVDTDAGVTASCAASPCDALPQLRTAPVLDGRPDCEGPGVELPRDRWIDADPLPPSHRVDVRVAWHPDGLYVHATVTDDDVVPSTVPSAPWCGDAVHLFVDDDGSFDAAPAYDDPGTAQLIVRAPDAAGATEGTRWDPSSARGPWPSDDFVATRTASGWVVETFLRRERLGRASSWRAGERLAWNLFVSVSGGPEASREDPTCGDGRLGDYGLFDRTEGSTRITPHASTTAFCEVTLVE
jgi:hypothetical protein